ncbi:MAG: BrnA antitoxin family protein [Tildeniella nuda ZEHNDER 1965/U140]|jgi:hypothetical protein|nr:BrnA antitoxin family protein [Tildeniella nuda ZEHNDER 1965/U140]
MKANEFDTRFDNGEDITNLLDLSQVTHPGYKQTSIDVDFPIWMLEALDQEAKRLGVTRQAIIKVWIADRLANLSH